MSTKKITTVGMLCAMAMIVNVFISFPIVPAVSFLRYDPKDILIVIGGFIYGPMTSLLMSFICSIFEIMLKGGNILDVLAISEKPKELNGYKYIGKEKEDSKGNKIYIYQKDNSEVVTS